MATNETSTKNQLQPSPSPARRSASRAKPVRSSFMRTVLRLHG